MTYLCKLVCPPGDAVLDPFASSGSTGQAGFDALLIERDAECVGDIRFRLGVIGQAELPYAREPRSSRVARQRLRRDGGEDGWKAWQWQCVVTGRDVHPQKGAMGVVPPEKH